MIIERADKFTQVPELLEEEEEEELVMQTLDNPKAGEPDWEYITLPIPDPIQVALATLWQNAEEVYVVDMEQFLFLKRICTKAVAPFIHSVKEHMAGYMDRPDDKQHYLREFQKAYNEFDDDFRADSEFKAELHCRISELRERLTEISDWKMMSADHERVVIIEKNWTAVQLIHYLNNYICALQLELDR